MKTYRIVPLSFHNLKQAMASIVSLPFEIILEILVRCPVKSLTRFKCVSRAYYNLISSAEFIKIHLIRQSQDSSSNRILALISSKFLRIVDFDTLTYTYEFDLPPIFCAGKYHASLIGSRDGLVCISYGRRSVYHVAIFNPCTRMRKIFPSDVLPDEACIICFGFGYDSKSDDYKVVRIVDILKPGYSREVRVCGLKADSWSTVQCLSPCAIIEDHGTEFKNILHWYGVKFSNGDPYVFCFDLGDEQLGELPVPDLKKKEKICDLAVSGGSLCMLSEEGHGSYDFSFWVMKEYGVKETWTKLSTFWSRHTPKLLVVGQEEVLLREGDKLSWYNARKKKRSPVEIANASCFHGATVTVRTLVPLPGGVPCSCSCNNMERTVGEFPGTSDRNHIR